MQGGSPIGQIFTKKKKKLKGWTKLLIPPNFYWQNQIIIIIQSRRGPQFDYMRRQNVCRRCSITMAMVWPQSREDLQSPLWNFGNYINFQPWKLNGHHHQWQGKQKKGPNRIFLHNYGPQFVIQVFKHSQRVYNSNFLFFLSSC